MSTTYTNQGLRRLGHVWAGADAGVYTLPANVAALRDAIDRVQTERTAQTKLPALTTGDDLALAICDAATAGKKFPSAAQLTEAEQQQRTRDAYATALGHALDQLQNDLETATATTAETIIAEHLRPALADLLDELATTAAALAGHGTDPAALLDAPDEARQARRRLDQLAQRYSALRNAQSALGAVTAPADDAGRYAELRNADDLLDGYRPGKVPWPTEDTIARLMWFATHDAEVWMPTPTERRTLAAQAAERSTLRPNVAAH